MSEGGSYGHMASLLRECCDELVAALGPNDSAPPRGAGPSPRAVPVEVTSFVELDGSALRATLAVALSTEFLHATHPRRARGVDRDDLVSWASEILNQLAGRLVNKLGRRGILLQIGIPGSLMGREIQLWFPFEEATVFEDGRLRVLLSLDEMLPDFEIPSEEERNDCRQEGDLLLF